MAFVEGISSEQILLLRMLLVTPVYILLGALYFKNKPILPTSSLVAALVGLLGYYLASYLDVKGLEYTGPTRTHHFICLPHLRGFIGRGLLQATPKQTSYAGHAALLYGHCPAVLSRCESSGADVAFGSALILSSAAICPLSAVGKKLIDQMGSVLFTCIAMSKAGIAMTVHGTVAFGLSPEAFKP